MYKYIYTFVVLVSLTFCAQAFAATTPYYMQYKKTYGDIAVELTKLQEKCKAEKDTAVCEEADVFARNLLAKKVQAFGEYFELVSSNFLNTFPGMNDEDLVLAVEDVKVQVTALKFSAVSFKVEELEALEQTANTALLINSDLAYFLSVNYHYYRLQKLYLVLTSTNENLAKEMLGAKERGLNTSVAQKELNAAENKLNKIREGLKSTALLYEQGETSQVTQQVKQSIVELYALFIEANNHLLKAATTLLRLTDNDYWELT
jgi:archaellum component FlaC